MRLITDKFNIIKNSESLLENYNIHKLKCNYCQKEIYAVWDDFNINNWNPYIGTMAVQKSRYKYSDIINLIRNGLKIDTDIIYPNDLVCTNARIHSDPSEDLIRFSEESSKVLCVDCFKRSYNRIKFIGLPDSNYYPQNICFNHEFSASIIKDRNETVYSVANDCHIKVIEIKGKGRIEEYH